MERSLVWSVFALGCVGWLYGMALTRARRGGAADEAGLARPFLVTAIVLPLLVFLATLPGRPPFAEGQGWGRGFLLGGAGALLAAWVLLRAQRSENHSLQAAAVVTAPCFVALGAVAIPLLWMRETIIDALTGVAIGWFVVSFVLYLGLTDDRASDHPITPSPNYPPPLLSGLAFTVTLCATAALGIYRGAGDMQAMRWSAAATAFAAGVPLALLVSALPTGFFARIALRIPLASLFARLFGRLFSGGEAPDRIANGWRLVLCALLLLGLGRLISVKALDQPDLFHLVGLGLLVGLLAWWVAAEGVPVLRRSGVGEPEHLTPLAALIILAGFMAAYIKLAGFGVGIMLLAAWPLVGMALTSVPVFRRSGVGEPEHRSTRTPEHLIHLLLFGTILLLYRLFTTRFGAELSGVSLTDHFALFGFLAGALIPPFLTDLLRSPAEPRLTPTGALVRLALAGIVSLATPALILILWGPKCALALLAGLALSGIQAAPEPLSTRTPEHLTPLFALAVTLALTQWTGYVLPLADMTRAQKTGMAVWVVAGLIVLILLADYGGRFGEWMRRRRSPTPPSPFPAREGRVGGERGSPS